MPDPTTLLYNTTNMNKLTVNLVQLQQQHYKQLLVHTINKLLIQLKQYHSVLHYTNQLDVQKYRCGILVSLLIFISSATYYLLRKLSWSKQLLEQSLPSTAKQPITPVTNTLQCSNNSCTAHLSAADVVTRSQQCIEHQWNQSCKLLRTHYHYQDELIVDETESNTIEWKHLSSIQHIKQAARSYIIGFSNTTGGVIKFGIEDKRGIVYGVDLDKLQCSKEHLRNGINNMLHGTTNCDSNIYHIVFVPVVQNINHNNNEISIKCELYVVEVHVTQSLIPLYQHIPSLITYLHNDSSNKRFTNTQYIHLLLKYLTLQKNTNLSIQQRNSNDADLQQLLQCIPSAESESSEQFNNINKIDTYTARRTRRGCKKYNAPLKYAAVVEQAGDIMMSSDTIPMNSVTGDITDEPRPNNTDTVIKSAQPIINQSVTTNNNISSAVYQPTYETPPTKLFPPSRLYPHSILLPNSVQSYNTLSVKQRKLSEQYNRAHGITNNNQHNVNNTTIHADEHKYSPSSQLSYTAPINTFKSQPPSHVATTGKSKKAKSIQLAVKSDIAKSNLTNSGTHTDETAVNTRSNSTHTTNRAITFSLTNGHSIAHQHLLTRNGGNNVWILVLILYATTLMYFVLMYSVSEPDVIQSGQYTIHHNSHPQIDTVDQDHMSRLDAMFDYL